jgi:ribonuclease HII
MGYILGIDEVGRGALAGPLVTGAVILGESRINGLKDSKLLSIKTRQELSTKIYKRCVFASLGWVSSAELDAIGLTAATTLAIKRSLEGFDYFGFEMIIDGSINYFKEYENARCIIKADQTIPAVSAAGIIAKVARDDYMKKLALKFPDYGFDAHVGYGTKTHRLNIQKHGACSEHRNSFRPLAAYT